MIETTKQRKIIGEFEQYVHTHKGDAGYTNYDDEVLEGVLALLKAQQPCVMTFDEIPKQNGSVVILETHRWSDGDYCATAKVKYSDLYNGITMFIDGYGWEVVCENDRYDVDWRCWTAYPSDEARKEAKWDNQSGRSNITKGS